MLSIDLSRFSLTASPLVPQGSLKLAEDAGAVLHSLPSEEAVKIYEAVAEELNQPALWSSFSLNLPLALTDRCWLRIGEVRLNGEEFHYTVGGHHDTVAGLLASMTFHPSEKQAREHAMRLVLELIFQEQNLRAEDSLYRTLDW